MSSSFLDPKRDFRRLVDLNTSMCSSVPLLESRALIHVMAL